MGRKKKQKEINTPEVIEPVEAKVEVTTKKEAITYQGTVSVTLAKNKQVMFKKQYHNTGSNKLFRFLCLCLAQQTSENIRKLAPNGVQLFTDPPLEDPTAVITIDSTPVMSDVVYAVERTVDSQNAVHFKFVIPGTAIQPSESGTTKVEIYQIGLYSQDAEGIWSDWSACFNFKSGNNWDPLVIQSGRSDYNLIIEWVITFTNA